MVADPNWANVSLLLSYEAWQPDQLPNRKTPLGAWLTAHGPVALDETVFKFGAKSGSLGGTGSTDEGWSLPSGTEWDLGSGDFTIETWYQSNSTSTAAGRAILSRWFAATGRQGWEFYRQGGTRQIGFRYSTGGVTDVSLNSPAATAWGTAWYHLCAMRSGNTLYLFRDGVVVASASVAGVTIFNAPEPLYIGRRQVANSNTKLPGYLDETRITKGVARYAVGGFTPPADAFPTLDTTAKTRTYQAFALAGDLSNQSARVSQSVALIAYTPAVPARITQSIALVADPAVRPALITQSYSLVALLQEPCVTQRCQCWTITRRDGVVLGFTSHDVDVTFRGVLHHRCASLNPSASENAADVGSVGNIELDGIISSDLITEADLYGGKYDDAYVEVWLVPWGGEGDSIHRLAAGWTGSLSQGDTGFQMEVLGPGARLEQQALVDVIGPGCRWVFGSPQCGVDIEALAIGGTVSFANRRGAFLAVLDPDTGSQWANGRVRFTAGPNDGAEVEIKSIDFGTGQVTLWASPPFLPLVGDTFDVLPGCDKILLGGCALYANQINFGGFPSVPGDDSLLETPDAKY